MIALLVLGRDLIRVTFGTDFSGYEMLLAIAWMAGSFIASYYYFEVFDGKLKEIAGMQAVIRHLENELREEKR